MKHKHKIAAAALALSLFAPSLALAICENLGAISPVSNVATNIKFTAIGPLNPNNFLKIYWADEQGVLHFKVALKIGNTITFPTRRDHVWVTTFARGNRAEVCDEAWVATHDGLNDLSRHVNN